MSLPYSLRLNIESMHYAGIEKAFTLQAVDSHIWCVDLAPRHSDVVKVAQLFSWSREELRRTMQPFTRFCCSDLVPLGQTRTKFNFNLDEKRVLNFENVVSDDDNIKQDMSIDVYGRQDKEETAEPTVAEKPAAADAKVRLLHVSCKKGYTPSAGADTLFVSCITNNDI